MKSSLKAYSLPDLQRLLARIQAEISRRSETNRKTVLRELQRVAKKHGFDLAALVDPERSGAGKKDTARPAKRAKKTAGAAQADNRRKVTPKYRHPEQKDLTWAGRGRKPKWVEEWLAMPNKSLDQLLIK
ncbi:MAG: H-NS histone family protein [Betaproteobacteria bacterium]|nr:H-NS histone family protein [Betaproteobacteria bacterium]